MKGTLLPEKPPKPSLPPASHLVSRGPPRRILRRIRHNLVILGAALVGGWAVGSLFRDLRTQVSAGTAYASLACVALTLALGPFNVLRHQPNPVSSDLRRDLGIWGAVLGLVHIGVGLTVHMRGKMPLYFLPPPEANAWFPLRTDGFGGANHLGLLAGIVLLVLLALSSDNALRWLGSRTWKRWQRLNYVGALAILAHGVLYQLLEQRRAGLVALFAVLAAGTLLIQLLGIRELGRLNVDRARGPECDSW